MEATRTLKLRIKDKHTKVMLAMARDVNTVWNFCNETQYRSLQRYANKPKVWLSGFADQRLLEVRGRQHRVGHTTGRLRRVCDAPQTVQKAAAQLARKQSQVGEILARPGSVQGAGADVQERPGPFRRHQHRPVGFVWPVEVRVPRGQFQRRLAWALVSQHRRQISGRRKARAGWLGGARHRPWPEVAGDVQQRRKIRAETVVSRV